MRRTSGGGADREVKEMPNGMTAARRALSTGCGTPAVGVANDAVKRSSRASSPAASVDAGACGHPLPPRPIVLVRS
jgi:hypothetical protein